MDSGVNDKSLSVRVCVCEGDVGVYFEVASCTGR